MHEADRRRERRGRLERAVRAQRQHIVDKPRAGGDGGAHDFGLRGIDRDRDRDFFRDRFDHRDHTVELFLHRYRPSAGSGGLAAHVDDRRALLRHAHGPGDGFGAVKKNTPVREGIGGDIQYPHHRGAGEVE